jgi:hypothetical protein
MIDRSREPANPSTSGANRLARAVPVLLLMAFAAVVVHHVSSTTFRHFIENNDVPAFVFQAKIFASGHLSVPSPPDRGMFSPWMVINDGTMYSKYPPVHSLWLALGILLFGSFKFMLLPAAALNVLLGYLAARELLPYGTALIATVLLATCPLFLLDSSTLLSHGTELLFLSLFLFCFLRADRGASAAWGAAAGVALALAFNTRYYQAALFGLLPCLYLAARLFLSERPDGRLGPGWNPAALRVLVPFGIAFAAVTAVLFLGYNAAVTGDPLTIPRFVWHGGEADRPYFSASHVLGSVPRILENMRLFGEWVYPIAVHPLSFLVLVALLRRDRWTWLLVGLSLAVFAGLGLYRRSYHTLLQIGPRYEMPLVLPFAILGAGFARSFFDLAFPPRSAAKRIAVVLVVGILAGYTLVNDKIGKKRRENERQNAWRDAPYEAVYGSDVHDAVVFLEAAWVGHPHGLFVNDPSFQGDIVFALDKGPVVDQRFMREYYPERRAYLLENNERLSTINTAPFEKRWLVAGPFEELSEDELLGIAAAEPERESGVLGSTWREVDSVEGPVNLVEALGEVEDREALAHLYVRSKEETTAFLLVGADDGLQVRLNGELVFAREHMDPLEPDQERVEIRLPRGWSRLLVAVSQEFGPWGFALKIVGEDGSPLETVDTWIQPPVESEFPGETGSTLPGEPSDEDGQESGPGGRR